MSQNYSGEVATTIETKAPNIQRFAQRTSLSIVVSIPEIIPFLYDIVQAYIQYITRLLRRVSLKAPKELVLPDNQVLEVIKPLYVIPESGLHCFMMYSTHHIERMRTIQSSIDPCLLYMRGKDGFNGIVLLQVYESL